MTTQGIDRRERLRHGGKSGRGQGWFLTALIELFNGELSQEITAEASELIRKRRLLDFSVQPGIAAAKMLGDKPQPQKVELHFPQLNPEQWEAVFDALSQKAYFLALMLLGRLPPETDDVFARAGGELIPSRREAITFTLDGAPVERLTPTTAALVLKLFEKLEAEPLLLVVLHGKGREEALAELRKRRSLLKSERPAQTAISAQEVPYEQAPPLISTTAYFWSAGNGMRELTYSIRADELPASILKWLDPLPLGGLEDQVDYLLEEAYEIVARLAQGYGLGL